MMRVDIEIYPEISSKIVKIRGLFQGNEPIWVFPEMGVPLNFNRIVHSKKTKNWGSPMAMETHIFLSLGQFLQVLPQPATISCHPLENGHDQIAAMWQVAKQQFPTQRPELQAGLRSRGQEGAEGVDASKTRRETMALDGIFWCLFANVPSDIFRAS